MATKTKTPAAAAKNAPAAGTTKLTRTQAAAGKKKETSEERRNRILASTITEQPELALDDATTNGGNAYTEDAPATEPAETEPIVETPAEVVPIPVPAEDAPTTPAEPQTDIMTTEAPAEPVAEAPAAPMNSKQKREAKRLAKEAAAKLAAEQAATPTDAAATLTDAPTAEGDKAMHEAQVISAQATNFDAFSKMVELGAVRCRQRNGQTVTGPVTQGVSPNGKPYFEVTVGRTKKDKPVRQSYWLHVLHQYLVIDTVKVMAGPQLPEPPAEIEVPVEAAVTAETAA